ncbi:Probable 3-phenylpropionic acid transporter [Providencia rustigianii]|uniref:3-phenylpropionate MFS transporter n=1 Tax=Providencia TaxID=586 RepID=UPI000D9E7598|nr:MULTISPECIES: 3-phenylpropionate MFS transporter [Providencia]MTC55155.1 3-phenylpropionate MFS transporter [Providencia rustigianii]MTC61204.1 3-phenylpropionate MFS transporter [Providencia rustigianii]SPY78103.1 Probable 3-phenylpropionic acid transporter [Providencia rustigianii]VEB71306.1 Probable 3-phenylpropionic acid transporter [Providencia rustigianii]VEH56003.1 Probable 3-phenylpropionic acid transporter [Providencia rustigianii]
MVIPSTRWLAIDYFTYFFAYSIFLPFWSVWLQGEGIDAEMIGVLLGIGLAARFLGAMFITPLVKEPSKLILALRLLATLSLIFSIGFAFGSHWAWLLFVMIGFNLFFAPMVPLGDSLAGAWQKQFTFDYGKIRVWGSIAFIIGSSLMGYLSGVWGHKSIMVALIISCAAMLLGTLLKPAIMPAGAAKTDGVSKVSFKQLIADKNVVKFLVCVSLLQGAHAAYYGFASLYWKEAGYSDLVIGNLWSLGVVAEVIVFMLSHRLFRRWSARNLLLLSAACGIIRWSMMGAFTSLPVLVMVQILHSGTFTVCHLAAMRFISARKENEIIPLQGAYSALAMGGGLAIITIMVGYIYERVPQQHGVVFFLMAILAVPALFIRPKVEAKG